MMNEPFYNYATNMYLEMINKKYAPHEVFIEKYEKIKEIHLILLALTKAVDIGFSIEE